MTVAREFLRVARHEIEQGRRRVETCLAKLSEEQIWSRAHEIENSVGNLVLHLAGNARQWIVSGVGGAPDSRDRAAEFSRRDPLPAGELQAALDDAVCAADRVLADLDPAALLETRKIQVYELTALQAVYHVTQHFAGHVGQIVWATKRMTGEDLGFYGYLKPGGGPAPPGAQP